MEQQQALYQQMLLQSGIYEVDIMDGPLFEEFLKALFISRGYHALVTKGSGDFGADLVLYDEDETIVVQAKSYSKNVGIRAVQEVVSARRHYNATQCWVVTNRYYTEPAIKLADYNHVSLLIETI